MLTVGDTDDSKSKLLYRELALHPIEHPLRPETLYHLASHLGERFIETSRVALLTDALRFCHEALELHSSTHPKRADSLILLVTLLRYHHNRFGEEASLNSAEDHCQQVLAHCPPRSPMHNQALLTSAAVLRERALNPRYAPDPDAARLLLERSLSYAESALELRPEGHPKRDEALEDLSVTLSDGRRRLKDDVSKTNDRAILLSRAVLALRPPGHPQRQTALYNLARFLTARYEEATTDITSLEEGVTLNKEALELCPAEHFFRADILVTIGDQYRYLWFHYDDMSFGNKVDSFLEEALRYLPSNHLKYPDISRMRAISLYEVYLNTGKIGLLDQSIKMTQDSLELLSLRRRYLALTALANMLRSRYQLTGDTQSLIEAICISRQALEICPLDDNTRSYALNTIATMLHLHYSTSQNASSLEEAVHFLREMIVVCPKGHPQNGWGQLKLAKALLDRFLLQRTSEDYEYAVGTMRNLLLHHELASVRNDTMSALAGALYIKYQECGEANTFKESIDYYENAIARRSSTGPERHSIYLATLSNAYLDAHDPERNIAVSVQYLLEIVRDEYGPPRGRFVEAKKLLAKLHNHWHRLLHEKEEVRRAILSAYQETIILLPLIANFGLDLAGRLRELALAQSLGSDAVSFALSCNEGVTSVEMSEDSRSVFWSQALNLRDAQFDMLPAAAGKELRDLFEALLRPQTSGSEYSDDDLADRRRLSERVHQLLSEVRQVEGLDRFLLGQPFSFLARAADKGPVAILTPNKYGCNVLVLLNSAGDWKSIPLPKISLKYLSELVIRTKRFGLSRGEALPLEDDSSRSFRIMKVREGGFASAGTTILQDIWNKIVWPIIEVLSLQKSTGRQRPRLHWCPTGDFSFIPLHAAGVYSGVQQVSCSDYVVSSYTPTLTALIQARDGLPAISRDSLSALVVAEASAPGLARIPHASEEAATVADVFGSSLPTARLVVHGLDIDTGSRVSMVLDALTEAHIVHLACHGQQHLTKPLDSRFCLRDGPLTVSMLMQLKLPRALFAFLSACETAQGDRTQPDQAIHLAAAMLFTGFRSIVATMWPMRDEDGPKVARIFYEELVKSESIDADTIPYALDTAVKHLRESGKASPERWASFIHIGA